MNAKIKYISIVILTTLLFIFFIIWRAGFLGLWQEGMAFIANNTQDFNDKNGNLIPGEYTLSIDLSDLKSNIGKEIYNDGEYRIYVSWIDNTGAINSGGYRIGFRSVGKYSLSGASLISGIQHKTVGEHSFTTVMTAKLQAEYKMQLYNSPTYGLTGLNYKSGDDFSFYLFPIMAYKRKEVTLEETGTVELTLSNLYKNIWTKSS